LLFKNIDFRIEERSIISVIGESGCGKSTLLYILSTFLKPTSGIVNIFDEDIYSISSSNRNKIRLHKVASIFQQHYLFRGFSVKENLEVSSKIANIPIDKKMISIFGLDKLMNLKTADLSGGEQQRLSILRALIKKPKIIFADEPTGNLDTKTRDNVMDGIFNYIEEYNSSIVLVTHDRELAYKSKQVYEIRDNELSQLKQ